MATFWGITFEGKTSYGNFYFIIWYLLSLTVPYSCLKSSMLNNEDSAGTSVLHPKALLYEPTIMTVPLFQKMNNFWVLPPLQLTYKPNKCVTTSIRPRCEATVGISTSHTEVALPSFDLNFYSSFWLMHALGSRKWQFRNLAPCPRW